MAVGRRGTPQQVGQTVDVGQVQPGAVVGQAGRVAVGRRRRSEPVDGVRVGISPVRGPLASCSSPPSLPHYTAPRQTVTLTVDHLTTSRGVLTGGGGGVFPGPGQPSPASPRPSPSQAAPSHHLAGPAGVPRVAAGAERGGDGGDTQLRGRGVEVARAESGTNKHCNAVVLYCSLSLSPSLHITQTT